MRDLRKFTEKFLAAKLHSDMDETAKDRAVIEAINGRDLAPTDRKKQVVHWLEYYKVLMFVQPDRKTAMADEIISFADEPREDSLRRDKTGIISEFDRLGKRICKIAKPKKNGEPPALTSLTSKALWCCYPNDVPVFDNNAASALRVISRLCHLVPAAKQSEYACFVDLWLQVYSELEPVIGTADLSGCPFRVRVLDKLLWFLGKNGFYG